MAALPRTVTTQMPAELRRPADDRNEIARLKSELAAVRSELEAFRALRSDAPAVRLDLALRSATLAITERPYDAVAAELDDTVVADADMLEPSPRQRLYDVLDALREAPGDLQWYASTHPEAPAALRAWAEANGLAVTEHSEAVSGGELDEYRIYRKLRVELPSHHTIEVYL